MRWIIASCVLMGIGLGGCIPSDPMADGELDGYWVLTEDASQTAHEHRPVVSGKALPSRWIIKQEPNVVWSTASIVQALEEMDTDAESVSFSISPAHAESIVEMMESTREVLDTLNGLAESAEEGRTGDWAELMAQTLVKIEQISRAVHAGAEGTAEGLDKPALAAEPLLRMVAVYVNENADGELLAGLGPEDIGRIQMVLTQMVLQIGFDLVGKQASPGLRHAVVDLTDGVEDLAASRVALEKLLSEQLDQAPASTRQAESTSLIRGALRWGPRGIGFLQGLIRQWDRMDNIELAFQERSGDPVLTMTLTVLPGKEVRLAEAVIFQPTIAFRGRSRVVIVPEHPQTGEAVVSFEPAGDGAVEMRFVGLPYTMARLAGLPLASGALRQVRVYSHSPTQGDRVVHAEVLMQASKDKDDPRRMMVYHDARRTKLARSALAIEEVTEHAEQVVTYFTPQRRYTYRRVKDQDQE